MNWNYTIQSWIARLIVHAEDPKLRVDTVKFFIKIAKYCQEIKNYNSLFEVVEALSLAPIQRLVKTWKSLPAKYKASWLVGSLRRYSLSSFLFFSFFFFDFSGLILFVALFVVVFQELLDIVSPSDNYTLYRELLRNSQGNELPSFAVYLHGLSIEFHLRMNKFNG